MNFSLRVCSPAIYQNTISVTRSEGYDVWDSIKNDLPSFKLN